MTSRRNTPQLTLAQIEIRIQVIFKRNAQDAWELGMLLDLAEKKVKEEGKQTWTAWKRSHGLSDTMVSRYVRLYKRYDSPDALIGLGVIEACELAGISSRG